MHCCSLCATSCAAVYCFRVSAIPSARRGAAGEPGIGIGRGLLVLLGVTHDDDPQIAATMADKVARLRILRDGNRDESAAVDLTAPVLVVSQFTLYADTNRGRRPSWSAAAPSP